MKLTFGSATALLLRADLALMLERDGATDSSRLLVLGRVSLVLPQEQAPLLTLNLDVVGEFDLHRLAALTPCCTSRSCSAASP